MYKKIKFLQDGIVKYNILQMVCIIILLFTFHFSLLAKNALPPLIKQGESFHDFNKSFYIDKHSSINTIAISSNGKYIVSSTSDDSDDADSIKIWDMNNGKLLKIFKENEDNRVYSVAISKNGKYIVSGSNGSIKIWGLNKGKLLRIFKEDEDNEVYSVAISSDGKYIVSGGSDKSIKIWDMDKGKLLRSLMGHKESVSSVAISSDGKYIVSGSEDGNIKIWDMSKGKLLRNLKEHKSDVELVEISQNGKYAVLGFDDGSINIWDISKNKLLKSLKDYEDSLVSATISQDGKYIVLGSEDGRIEIWDVSKGERKVRSLAEHKDKVTSVAISSNGKSVVSCSSDGSIKIWDISKGVVLKNLEGHRDIVSSVAISGNGKYIVSGYSNSLELDSEPVIDGSIKIWDMSSGKLIKSLEGHTGDVNSVATSSDGKYIVSGSADGSIKIWDINRGKLLRSLKENEDSITSIALSSDGKYIVSGSENGNIKIWDMSKGKLLRNLNKHKGIYVAYSVAISKDGKYIVSSFDDGNITIWKSMNKIKQIRNSKSHYYSVHSVAINGDSTNIVSASADGSIKIWDMSSGKLIKSLEGHKESVNSIVISQDGKYLISGSEDGSIKIWDMSSGKLLRSLDGHKESVNSVAISTDGKYIVSGSTDGSIKIWDINKKSLLKTLIGGQRGTWLSIDHSKSLFYRGDDGTLLYKRNGSSLKSTKDSAKLMTIKSANTTDKLSTAKKPIDAKSLSFEHYDWQVVCDNTHFCRIAGYSSDDSEDYRISVLIKREAGAKKEIKADIQLGHYGGEKLFESFPSSFKLSMFIDGKSYGFVTMKKDNFVSSLSAKQTEALINSLSKSSKIVWKYQKHEWQLSDKGSTAVLLKADEFQKRLNTQTAFYKRGDKNEKNVLKAQKAPIIYAKKVDNDKEIIINDELYIKKLKRVLYLKDKECFEIGDTLTFYNLDDSKMAVTKLAWTAAYNSGECVWVVNKKEPFNPLPAIEGKYSVENHIATVSNSQKGRGLGDCWSRKEYVWTGKSFEQSSATSTGLCRLIAPGGAWNLPTFVSVVKLR